MKLTSAQRAWQAATKITQLHPGLRCSDTVANGKPCSRYEYAYIKNDGTVVDSTGSRCLIHHKKHLANKEDSN